MPLRVSGDRINIAYLSLDLEQSDMYITGGKASTLLETLSQNTWERLKHSLEFNISQGEETITDINLLDIKRSGVKGIDVWKCPKDDESKTGIDWEWFIGSDRVGWLRYAVQAKKLKLGTGVYDKLSYKVRGRPQAEILESYAYLNNSIPLYCLYNYVDYVALFDKYWHCDDNVDTAQLGCTVTPLSVIKESLTRSGRTSKRTFDYLHSNECTIPWRCLVKCSHVTFIYRKRALASHPCFGEVQLYPIIPENVRRLFVSEGDAHPDVKYETNSDVIPKRVMVVELDVSGEFVNRELLPEVRKF